MILLDTNIVSELAKPRPSPHVLAWLAGREASLLYLSAITLGEIDMGARAHPDSARRAKLIDWCDGLQTHLFKNRILPFDAATARMWGSIVSSAKDQGRSLEWRDSQIASTALRFGTRLATRNMRHFSGLGLDLVDPFVAPS